MTKSMIAAVVVAAASLGSPAVMAQTVGTPTQALDLTDGSAFFGDTFAAGNSGATFTDHFTFTVPTAATWNLDAVVSSISRTQDTGLDITGFSVYSTTGRTPVSSGAALQSGRVDVWTVAGNSLAAGDYYLQVTGNVVSDQATSIGGVVALAPVPEPETYGLMLGGLGVLGWLARRRRNALQA